MCDAADPSVLTKPNRCRTMCAQVGFFKNNAVSGNRVAKSCNVNFLCCAVHWSTVIFFDQWCFTVILPDCHNPNASSRLRSKPSFWPQTSAIKPAPLSLLNARPSLVSMPTRAASWSIKTAGRCVVDHPSKTEEIPTKDIHLNLPRQIKRTSTERLSTGRTHG